MGPFYRTQRTLSAITVAGSLAFLSCGRPPLSRDAAANAIIASDHFPSADSRQLERTFSKLDSSGHVFKYAYNFGSNMVEIPDVSYFLKADLLTSPPTGNRGNVFSEHALAFTGKTKVYETPISGPDMLGLRLCDLTFGEITGIQLNDQAGTAVVEYTVKRTNWTPFGEYYRKSGPADLPDTTARKASFTRYDDGWRLTRPPASGQ